MTDTLGAAARAVLLTADADAKAAASRAAAAAWRSGALAHEFPGDMPQRPARPSKPELLPPNKMPRRGKAGSARSRVSLLHALAHIELNAIDLAWDLVGRFGADMPRAFADDWVGVADDEARHFSMLVERLSTLGATYGDMPAHDGLWEAAISTAADFTARLVIVPLVLEARGLDVTPMTQERLRSAGDIESAALIHEIYLDEIKHVSVGSRWFHQICDDKRIDPVMTFHSAVKRYFRGVLKPPFNDSARIKAGLTPHYYDSLAST